jgi:hypothetical protein
MTFLAGSGCFVSKLFTTGHNADFLSPLQSVKLFAAALVEKVLSFVAGQRFAKFLKSKFFRAKTLLQLKLLKLKKLVRCTTVCL